MNISLPKELENYVNQKVSSGLYTSASEVVRESLRVMLTYEDAKKQQLLKLNQEIQAGVEQAHQNKIVTASKVYSKLKNKIEKESN
ncbi:MAG: type II toxin-antitoxin system ParD family antitoxin [Gammaproteobacteria bacterium]|nr:type II toxin-antitoxin system ParD family antitoxin [Gammaproteobacteria bacterium]